MAKKAPKKKIPKLNMPVTRELRLLHKIFEICSGALSVEDVLKGILSEISIASKFPIGAIELYDTAQNGMHFAAITGMELSEGEQEFRSSMDSILSGTVVSTQKPLAERNPERQVEFWISHGMKSYFGFPMISGNRCIGALGMVHPEAVDLEQNLYQCLAYISSIVANFVSSATTGEQLEKAQLQLADRHKGKEERAEYSHPQPLQDELTSLPNEALFRYLFSQGLARSRRHKEMIALIVLDLDHFGAAQKRLGKEAAESFIRQIAERLRRNVREGDTVARFGRDEFVWCVSNLQDMEDLAIIAEKMLAIVKRPLQFGGKETVLTTSIGISVYPIDGGDADQLLHHAGTALIRAKELGRDTFQFYTEEVNSRLRERLALKRQLHEALGRQEFLVHYQPILSVVTEHIEGVEALLRLRNSDGRLSYPQEFINVSEETGLIALLDEWVIRTSCLQMKAWEASLSKPLCLSVNISKKFFNLHDLAEKILMISKETGFPTQYLELELTEQTLMEDPEKSVQILQRLRDTGVRVAIDDFGTGLMSFNFLSRLPVHSIKIDSTFVRKIDTDPRNSLMVSGMISLAHTLGFRVTAEGVEAQTELNYLRAQKCDQFQGILISAAVVPDRIPEFLGPVHKDFAVDIPIESMLAESTRSLPEPEFGMIEGDVDHVPISVENVVSSAPAVAVAEPVRSAISRQYLIHCFNCRNTFDAMDAGWCSCLVSERTLVCPFCSDCFCKAPLEYKLDFWTEAPQNMWDRRIQEEKSLGELKPNPLPTLVRRPLVLIVDDEVPILKMATHSIEGLGYGVVTGSNGEQGLELARDYMPDLILTDALMPRMDGREMCRKIKMDSKLSRIKVVIMTSLSTRPRDKMAAFKEFKVDEYLQKPLAFHMLRSVLERFLS